ncbi:MAG: YbjQ family protein [Bacteroidetes bacterium]|nr:YbjQ family protein [Bacteroidota bacterium]MBS1758271.1 YbjQ family protein [Bacteroidota bacterium]
MVDQQLITTSNQLEGYKIIKHLGVVRGITVRSRSLLGNMAGGFQTIFGGKITIYANLCEKAREEAFNHMVQHAQERAANAIINVRYDANDVMSGVTEVLCYGTAVQVVNI